MRIVPLLFGLFLMLSGTTNFSFAAKPQDVYGWGNLKWGMSGQEVMDVLGKGIEKKNPKHDKVDGVYSELQLKGVSIGGDKFRLIFWMDENTDKLKKIVFVPEQKPEEYEWVETFIRLEQALVGKYGAPDVEETSNDPGVSAERKWNFPSTKIEMSYLKIESTEMLLMIFSGGGNS